MFGTSEKKRHCKRWYTVAAFFLGTILSLYTPQATIQESEGKGIVWTEHFDGSSSVDGRSYSPTCYLDFGVGYSRSMHYSLNTVSFGIGVNVGSLISKAKGW